MLAFACVLPGIIGHDPWKADEGYTFGNNYDLLQTGDWVVAHFAGEPFMEKPPRRVTPMWLALIWFVIVGLVAGGTFLYFSRAKVAP